MKRLGQAENVAPEQAKAMTQFVSMRASPTPIANLWCNGQQREKRRRKCV
jgi:hypothetical protein